MLLNILFQCVGHIYFLESAKMTLFFEHLTIPNISPFYVLDIIQQKLKLELWKWKLTGFGW